MSDEPISEDVKLSLQAKVDQLEARINIIDNHVDRLVTMVTKLTEAFS